MWFRFIWIKSFRKMIRKMERRCKEESISKIKDTIQMEGSIDYLNGIDDGYYLACEDILKWIEKKEKKRKNS